MENIELMRSLCRVPVLTESLIIQKLKNSALASAAIKWNSVLGGFEICSSEFIYFVPEKKMETYNQKSFRLSTLQQKILPLAIPLPLYLGEGTVVNQLYTILDSETPYEDAALWLQSNFSIEIAVAYYNNYFSPSECLGNYKTIIFESIEAYYLGMDHIATIALLPVLEGGLRNLHQKILSCGKGNVSAEQFDKYTIELLMRWGKRSFPQFDWYPGKGYNPSIEIDFFTHNNEQCDVINSFRIFFKDVLYRDSNASSNGFNRHLILHLLKNDFNDPSNFIRIFIALTHLVFIESLFNDKIPTFWRGVSQKDRELARYVQAISKVFGDRRCKVLNELGISNYDLES